MPKIPVFHPPKTGGGSSSPSGGSGGGGGSSSSGGGGGSSSGGSSGGGGGGHSGGGGGGKGRGKGKGRGPRGVQHDGHGGGPRSPKGKGGGGGGNPYGGKGYKAKSAHRNYDLAQALQGQIKALRWSLNTGFERALRQRLANIKLIAGQQDATLMEGYRDRYRQLDEAADANEKAAGDASQQNVTNRARERTNAVTEALNMGAGESDVLRSQMMSLRSWDANQGEINRSYFDSLHGLNSSLTDLKTDTKTARVNMASQANADRDMVWSSYFDQKSETYTNLGNAYGMQGEYYGLALEQKGNKGVAKKRKQAVKGSNAAFMGAAKVNSRAFENPGVPGSIKNWEGNADFEGQGDNRSRLEAAAVVPETKRPEGASLRKWTT